MTHSHVQHNSPHLRRGALQMAVVLQRQMLAMVVGFSHQRAQWRRWEQQALTKPTTVPFCC